MALETARDKIMIVVEKHFGSEVGQGYNILCYKKFTKELIEFCRADSIDEMLARVNEMYLRWETKFVLEQRAKYQLKNNGKGKQTDFDFEKRKKMGFRIIAKSGNTQQA